jgi:hypothetical protein
VRFKRKPELVICLLICKQISILRFTLNTCYISNTLISSGPKDILPFQFYHVCGVIIFNSKLSRQGKSKYLLIHFIWWLSIDPCDALITQSRKKMNFGLFSGIRKQKLFLYVSPWPDDPDMRLYIKKIRLCFFYPRDPCVCHYITKIQMSVPSSMTNKSGTRKKMSFVLFSVIMGALSS